MPNSLSRPSFRVASADLHRGRSSLLAALLLLACAPALAQDIGGAIQGTVVTAEGQPVAGAEVEAASPALQAPRRTRTDSSGQFQLLALPLGSYAIRVSHPDWQPTAVQNVPVQLGRTTALPRVTLTRAGQVVEEVEVVGRAPLIDPVSTAGGGTLPDEYFDRLPLSRDYQSIATLLPAVNESFYGDGLSIDGASGYENRTFIDGVDVTDPLRGSRGINLPHDFIQSVEVKTGGYQAEYRAALGGLINVVTPSGGDAFTGNLFGYWAGHQFSAAVKSAVRQLETRDFTQYDVGFSLGGPLAGAALRYFVAYNPLVETAEIELPGQGYFPDELVSHRFAGNLGWQIDAANNLTLTVAGDPTSHDSVGDPNIDIFVPVSFDNPDPYLVELKAGGISAALRGTHVLSPRTLLESSLSAVWQREWSNAATERGARETLFIDNETGAWSGGPAGWSDGKATQATAAIKGSWILGSHAVKAGAEYRQITTQQSWHGNITTRFSDDFYFQLVLDQEGTVENRIPTLFVQDSWQIGSRFTLNYGLRWDGVWNLGTNGRVAQRWVDQYQPRLGFVWEPGPPGSQRVFGSAARYYQEVLPYFALSWENGDQYVQTLCSYDHDPRVDPSGGNCMDVVSAVLPEVDGLRGNHYDEYTLGYEARIGQQHRGQVRAVYRTLQDILEDSLVLETGEYTWGNPGRGALAADYPRASRTYEALELVFERRPGQLGYLLSYVLSRTKGNYTGLFDADYGWGNPDIGATFDTPDNVSSGLLPNDRTHAFKASGFYAFDFGLNLGGSMTWQSGTPLNEWGGSPYGTVPFSFLQPRGTAGRTPSILDLNLRADYTFGIRSGSRWKPRLILDVYHLLGDNEPVRYDQRHYYNVDADGNQVDPNPTYGEVTRYSPPTTVRLGLEFSF